VDGRDGPGAGPARHRQLILRAKFDPALDPVATSVRTPHIHLEVHMRTLCKVIVDNEAGNRAIESGRMGAIIGGIVEKFRPEAAYFSTSEGIRTAWFVIDFHDSSQLPSFGEPLFQELKARIEFKPVMNGEELQKGLAGLAKR
jgi:hypothetical protein